MLTVCVSFQPPGPNSSRILASKTARRIFDAAAVSERKAAGSFALLADSSYQRTELMLSSLTAADVAPKLWPWRQQ